MRSKAKLLMATAIVEFGAGVLLMTFPDFAIWLLLAVQGPAPEAVIVSRILGAALLAIGTACWIGRDDPGSPSQRALVWGALVYNVVACLVMVYAGSLLGMAGLGLWVAVVYHAAMAAWCVVAPRRSTTGAP